jgi:glutathione synthase/RimK-type ligase-like ATP-grasp enzyme
LTDISILYDRSETDELGIRLTAEKRGIVLGYLPFHKVAVGFGNKGFKYSSLRGDLLKKLDDTRVVINRTQSKNRRMYAAMILDAFEKDAVNPLTIEIFCESKIRTLLAFQKAGIGIPETVYVPCNVREQTAGSKEFNYNQTIVDLIKGQLGDGKIVLKPDSGTHGRGIVLADGLDALRVELDGVSPSIINPSGVLAQEFIPKWFYDLRIIVWKEMGSPYRCVPTAMVRGGFTDFRTNAHLGNMVFRVNLPENIMEQAVKCGEAISGSAKVGTIALDAMPYIGDTRFGDEEEIKDSFIDLKEYFEVVRKVKADPRKMWEFKAYSKKVEEAYGDYMDTDAYAYIQSVIQESLEKTKDKVLFHEGNSCPEFWEQPRG